jgi:hypothetical protein
VTRTEISRSNGTLVKKDRSHHRQEEQDRRDKDRDQQEQRHSCEEGPVPEILQHRDDGAGNLGAGDRGRDLAFEVVEPSQRLGDRPLFEPLCVGENIPVLVDEHAGVGAPERVEHGSLGDEQRHRRTLRVVEELGVLRRGVLGRRRVDEHAGVGVPIVFGRVGRFHDAHDPGRELDARSEARRYDHLLPNLEVELLGRHRAYDGLQGRPKLADTGGVGRHVARRERHVVLQIGEVPEVGARRLSCGLRRRERVDWQPGEPRLDAEVDLVTVVYLGDVVVDRVGYGGLGAAELELRQGDAPRDGTDVGERPVERVDRDVQPQPLQ